MRWCRWLMAVGPAVSTLVVSGKTAARVASWAAVLADWMEGAGRRGAAGRCGPHAQPPPGPARQVRHGVCRVIGRRRSPGCGRWPPGCRRRGWCCRMRGRAGRVRCSCTPGRVRSGPGWAANCWPMSRHSPRRSPSWSRIFVAQTGFSLHDVLADGAAGDRHRADPAGAGGHAAGADRVVAFLRGGTRCGDRTFDG